MAIDHTVHPDVTLESLWEKEFDERFWDWDKIDWAYYDGIAPVVSTKATTTPSRGNNATVSALFTRFVPHPPIEIIGIIVGELRSVIGDDEEWRGQLYIVARTSRQLRVEAERNLYQDVVMIIGEPHFDNMARILQSRVARYVRTLEIANYGKSRTSETPDGTIAAIPFHLLTGLCSLKVYCTQSTDRADELEATLLDPCLFELLDKDLPPNILDTFVSSLPLRPSDLSFLDNWPRIIRLTVNPVLSDSESAHHIVKKHKFRDLDDLEVVHMDPTASAIVAGARPSFLTITKSILLPNDWQSFAVNLVVLDTLGCALVPTILRKLVVCSPQLVVFTAPVHGEWETQNVALSTLSNRSFVNMLYRIPRCLVFWKSETSHIICDQSAKVAGVR